MYKWARLGVLSRNRTFYRALRFLFAIPVCHAILVNQTIDSNKGDPVTGFVPIYQPQNPWADETCSGCYIQPDTSKAFDGTWNAATYHPELQNVNFTLQFTGVAVWVFLILSNANSHGPGTTTNTQVNITLDGQHAGTFSHNPDMTTQDLIYNANIFSQSGLSNTQHELVVATNDYPFSTFINFDWAIYTAVVDTPTPPTSSSTSLTTAATTNSVSTSTQSTSSSTPTNSTYSSTLNAHAPASQSASSSISAGSSSTDNSSSTFTTSSPTPTSQTSSSKIGVIVGCTLGGLAIIILVLLFLIRRWRREPPVRYEKAGGMTDIGAIPRPQPNLTPQPPVPFHEPSESKAARLREVRQMEIDERIQSAQREMDYLNSVQSASEVGSSGTARSLRPASELVLLRSELQQLRDQIGSLQAQRGSDLTLGLSDELHPPAYTRH